ncbi:MAG: ATP-binding cassette domain-containing protein [Pseudomonadales bacterium]
MMFPSSSSLGKVVGLLGHNGAGKTTIMKMLTGYLEPSAGSIRIDGEAVTDTSRAVREKIGYLPESLPIYPELIVADYLAYVARLRGLDPALRFHRQSGQRNWKPSCWTPSPRCRADTSSG